MHLFTIQADIFLQIPQGRLPTHCPTVGQPHASLPWSPLVGRGRPQVPGCVLPSTGGVGAARAADSAEMGGEGAGKSLGRKAWWGGCHHAGGGTRVSGIHVQPWGGRDGSWAVLFHGRGAGQTDPIATMTVSPTLKLRDLQKKSSHRDKRLRSSKMKKMLFALTPACV